jgi:ElaB/YqjD/DUF883 family membrane-anchored ribosome-binding protein
MNASTTVNDNIERTQNGGSRAGKGVGGAADQARRTAATELGNLIADIEELLGKVASVADIDIVRVRQRLQEKLATAKDTLAAGSKQLSEKARQAVDVTEVYVRQSPWQAIGIAALGGALVGFLLARR